MWQAAAGFMQMYAYLVRDKVNFRKAQRSGLGVLIPIDDGETPIAYKRFAQFITLIAELDDDRVTPQ
jgi:hypothetical protein